MSPSSSGRTGHWSPDRWSCACQSRSSRSPTVVGLPVSPLKEAGPEVYAYCSGCHAPAAVVSGLIPGTEDADLPVSSKGVTCDVCHQISSIRRHVERWGEPGNASFVLEPGKVKFGPKATMQAQVENFRTFCASLREES